jgi:bifunctional non-homologous end joining protein LigD
MVVAPIRPIRLTLCGDHARRRHTQWVLPRVLPMKAVTGELPAVDEGWAYEVKWDGMRAVAYVNDPDGRPLRLETTRGLDATARFPELAGLPGALEPHAAVLDGELVAFDEGGRPSFGRIQHRIHVVNAQLAARRAAENPVQYHVFDVMHVDSHNLTALPYLARRKLLTELVSDGPNWRVPPHYIGGGADLLDAARTNGLEGIMAKRVDSLYLPGKRSPSWRKVKVRPRQEFVVGGWQPGHGGRAGRLGSLLLGYHDQSGSVRYAGKVGTGFTEAELARLGQLLAEREVSEPPFDPAPPRPVARAAHWARPDLVAEVTFAEWTSDGTLRQPSYIGLRADKDPADVVRES